MRRAIRWNLSATRWGSITASALRLLRHWHLPEKLAGAIERQSRTGEPRAPHTDEQVLAAALRMADLIAQLVGQRRLSVLPDLLAMGDTCCGMTRPHLTELVGKLQPQVEQFAAALTVELEGPRDYSQVLADAHAQLAVAAELAAHQLLSAGAGGDDALCNSLLAEAHDLSSAMRSYLHGRPMAAAVAPRTAHRWRPRDSSLRRAGGSKSTSVPLSMCSRNCCRNVGRIVRPCRWCYCNSNRTISPPVNRKWFPNMRGVSPRCSAQQTGCAPHSLQRIDDLLAVVLVAGDRHDAVQWAYNLERLAHQSNNSKLEAELCEQLEVKAGIAHLAVAPKTFEVVKLWENAQRCLEAARSASGAAVKSIEVY